MYDIFQPRKRSPHFLLRKTTAISFAVLAFSLTGTYIASSEMARAQNIESAAKLDKDTFCSQALKLTKELHRPIAAELAKTCL